MAIPLAMLGIFSHRRIDESIVDYGHGDNGIARGSFQTVFRILRVAVKLPEKYRLCVLPAIGAEAVQPAVSAGKNHLRHSVEDADCGTRPLAVQNIGSRRV